MIIRHAEKPDADHLGVKESGDSSKHSLTVRGWQRAGALACLFAAPPALQGVALLARPQFLFASAPSGGEEGGAGPRSRRSQETLQPLSDKLKVEINLTFGKGQERQLAEAAQQCEGAVLIAWQHEAIADIANAILRNSETAPQSWPPDRFDLIYVLTLDSSRSLYTFDQAGQFLLASDRAPEPHAQ